MRKAILLLLVAVLAINGLAMLGWPETWYHTLPTVPHTGPFNAHFVRDIGCAYLTCAGAMLFFALDPERGRPAALAAVAFLTLHALVHLWDAAAGRSNIEHLADDFAGVFLVPMLALWLSWPRATRSISPVDGERSC
jgi:hypothetical protein